MNRDDFIRMAHEADCLDEQHYGSVWANKLELFAQRVAAAAKAEEREMCAKLVEEMVKYDYDLDDFAKSVRVGGWRLCSDGRPKWLKISMEVAAEREACAKVCESFTTQNDYDRNDACGLIADAIRARSVNNEKR